jgi:hypothetical protein
MVLQLVDVGTLLLNQKVADILPDPCAGRSTCGANHGP